MPVDENDANEYSSPSLYVCKNQLWYSFSTPEILSTVLYDTLRPRLFVQSEKIISQNMPLLIQYSFLYESDFQIWIATK